MRFCSALTALLLVANVGAAAADHAWPTTAHETLAERFAPPDGYRRTAAPDGSFAAWLRQLPVLPGRPPVTLWNGQPKGNQTAHAAVLDIDVGKRDLQQCADAVMRLRAEYLKAAGKPSKICFHLSDGSLAAWTDWQIGYRPRMQGKRMQFVRTAAANSSYKAFRQYLDLVFSYAGSMSLSRELSRVPTVRNIEAGDVFVKGGFPGHAVIVLDVAERDDGERVFLLAQSYMPAQQIHVLRNPNDASAWYHTSDEAPLLTPEWAFAPVSLHRFPNRNCESNAR
ncbi:MAG: DUF4846 domain-containing protein [Deltaproteobacteria bacterium]|nr:DUF4846 domain-containing protein [Deltaproteobacteria bacterium]